MTTFTTHPLYLALTAVGVLVASSAHAVNVSADGRGQVLLYPYYTTRADSAGNPYGTLVSVINATASAKAVRVRFLEGKNSREVLDFNLFLSPFDVWAAAVLADPVTGGARIGTTDLSCTLPAFSASPTAPYISFSNASYSGANDDGAGAGLDRTKEGYFEVIEMASYSPLSVTGKAITHVNGAPPCNSRGNVLNDTQAAFDSLPLRGGLFGGLTLINVNSGTDYTADATALTNFYQTGGNYRPITSMLPDLTQATPPVSSVQGPDGRLYESTWATSTCSTTDGQLYPCTADPVSAVLMHDSMMNEFVLDTATKSGTDWVMTMPTKRYYVPQGSGNASKLFQRNFNGSLGSCDDLNGSSDSCYSVSTGIYDREENTYMVPFCGSGPPPQITQQACWSANVITFNNGSVLGSANVSNAITTYQNGWAIRGFPIQISGARVGVHELINSGATTVSGGGQIATGASATYLGLPAIGFAVASFSNGTLVIGTPPASVLSNYGGNFAHKASTTIQAYAILPGGPTGCVVTINGGSAAVLPVSGGIVTLLVRNCTTSSASPINYMWSVDGTPLPGGGSMSVPANTTGLPITRMYRLRACVDIACSDFPPTPLTLTIAGN